MARRSRTQLGAGAVILTMTALFFVNLIIQHHQASPYAIHFDSHPHLGSRVKLHSHMSRGMGPMRPFAGKAFDRQGNLIRSAALEDPFKVFAEPLPQGCARADEHASCSAWAQAGECTKNEEYMRKVCECSCILTNGDLAKPEILSPDIDQEPKKGFNGLEPLVVAIPAAAP